MKVTVCQTRDDPDGFAEDWERLAAHVQAEASDLVLLPEMPFARWFAGTRPFDLTVWQAAVRGHDDWLQRITELGSLIVLGSRPVSHGTMRLNEGFVWEPGTGYRAAHQKYYLPDEDGYWEASWYQRGPGSFAPVDVGTVRAGFLICTDLWFLERARRYGAQGVHLVCNPRATELATGDRWLAGARTAAIVSGAYLLSSNRAGVASPSPFGGQGWIIDPDGQVLGLTSDQRPFVTCGIDLSLAEQAKQTYPRYVRE
jgi:N-carbamoylputrescine amidase